MLIHQDSSCQVARKDKQVFFKETTKGDAKSGCADWVSLIRERPKDKPFFLWLAALDPHRPYDEGILDQPHLPAAVRVAPYHPDTFGVRREYALYYDEISRLDRFTGLVISELRKQSVLDKTLVIFCSDNGRPFPRDKTTLYDSGIRTPFIIRYPPLVKSGSVCNRLISAVDIAPTLLEIAGVKRGDTFDGVSFSGLLENPLGLPVRSYAFAEKNWHDYEDHSRAVRGTQFKYIRNYYDDLPPTPPADAVRGVTYKALGKLHESADLSATEGQLFWFPRPREELYDCSADPHELKNLAEDSSYAKTLALMREAMHEWERDTGDRVPELRTADEFDRRYGKPTPARVRPRWSKKKMVKAGLTAP